MGAVKEGWIKSKDGFKLTVWPVLVNWYCKEGMAETIIEDMLDSLSETGEIAKEQYNVFMSNGRLIRDNNIWKANGRVEVLKEQLRLAKRELKEIQETEQSPECCMCHKPLMEHTYKQFAMCMTSEVIKAEE